MRHALQKSCENLVRPTAAIYTLCVHYAMHFRNKVTTGVGGGNSSKFGGNFQLKKENHWLYTTRVYTNSMVDQLL